MCMQNGMRPVIQHGVVYKTKKLPHTKINKTINNSYRNKSTRFISALDLAKTNNSSYLISCAKIKRNFVNNLFRISKHRTRPTQDLNR
jgi:hypothetical protein